MKEGEAIHCPHCNEQSAVKLVTVMDGWSVAGKHLACALCGAKLGEPASPEAAKKESAKAVDAFAALLGEGAEAAPKADLTPDENYGRFCRNCREFIVHPFRTMCGKFQRPADPMGECPDFAKKD